MLKGTGLDTCSPFEEESSPCELVGCLHGGRGGGWLEVLSFF